jgi:hypothetical protein
MGPHGGEGDFKRPSSREEAVRILVEDRQYAHVVSELGIYFYR